MNTSLLIHEPMMEYWKNEYEEYEKTKNIIYTRFQRAEGILGVQKKTNGDELLEKLNDLFINGFGTKWSNVQMKIWRAIVDAILPLIYGTEWDEVKERVLKQRNLSKVALEVLVNMARRNGKTWLVSGACAAIFLTLKGIIIAIFSVGKRQSGLFLTCCSDKIKAAFRRGTHSKQTDFKPLQSNQETIIFECSDGSKNILSSLPGSIKVSLKKEKKRKIIKSPPVLLFFINI